MLLILLILSFPHSYVLAPDALRVRAGITRWVIPYRAITIRDGRAGSRFRSAWAITTKWSWRPPIQRPSARTWRRTPRI